jgi:hypothetical protein
MRIGDASAGQGDPPQGGIPLRPGQILVSQLQKNESQYAFEAL